MINEFYEEEKYEINPFFHEAVKSKATSDSENDKVNLSCLIKNMPLCIGD